MRIRSTSKTEPTGEKVIADGAMAAGSVSVQSAHTGYVAELWKGRYHGW